jgi:hypothetical protein
MSQDANATSDEGAYAILYGLLVVVLVMTAGIVVDLSGMREDRRAERLAADAASTAGAVKLNALGGIADAQAACQEAWRFLKVNLPGADSASADCPSGTFPSTFTTCPAAARSVTGPAGPWRVTVTWPVPDDHPLMTDPSVTGRNDYQQPLDAEVDGADPCGRLGVSVSRVREFLFAGVGGFVSGATSNASVARAELRGQVALEFPLVVLDQHGCGALTSTGSSPSGAGIVVKNNGITPGRIALDSAGDESGASEPGCDNSQAHVAEASGGARIVAWNGSSGAAGMILSFGPVAKAAPEIQLCAPGTDPSTVTDRICPSPTTFQRITRKYWDWQYHCNATTIEPLSAPCPYTASVPDHIAAHRSTYGVDALNASNATARGFTVISGGECNSKVEYRYFEPGNYYVDCAKFSGSKTTVFGGGAVVFRGDVELKGQGGGPYCTVFNQEVGPAPAKDADGFFPVCSPAQLSSLPDQDADTMYVYLQDGSLTRQNSDLIAHQTFIYQEADPSVVSGSEDHRIQIGAGTAGGSGVSGTLILTAPVEGPFSDLALWSENTAPDNDPNGLGAQTRIALEGIFFLPNAQVEFSGNGTYLGPPRAQFVAWRLATVGGASLEMVPDAERTLTIPVGGVRLIR